MRRLIAHLDMDAFYASVELLRYPELQGLPVVIGAGRRHAPWIGADGTRCFSRLRDYTGRGVITTSTYAAREFGIFSAMGVMKAAKLAPDAILLPVDFEQYRHHSRLFKAAVREIAPLVEDRGIDEIYLDLSDQPGAQQDGGEGTARRLKAAVQAATGLRCSIGVAPNKLLAKICSDLDKPDGLTLLAEDELISRIWPLPAKKINGIGPKASARLAGFAIHTIGDLAAADPVWLIEEFGKGYGAWLHAAAHGRDQRPLVTHSEPVSISRETTFERDLHAVRDRSALSIILDQLCEQLASDLQRKSYAARNVAIKLRFDDFKIVSRAVTLLDPVSEAAAIRAAAGQCLKRVDLSRRLRLLGVRAGALLPMRELAAIGAARLLAAERQAPLF